MQARRLPSYELRAKSVDTVTGLAAAASETAKEYTARKKEESERELKAKRAAQNQVFISMHGSSNLYVYFN